MTDQTTYGVSTLYVRQASPSACSTSGIRALDRARDLYAEELERARLSLAPWEVEPPAYVRPIEIVVTLHDEHRVIERETVRPGG